MEDLEQGKDHKGETTEIDVAAVVPDDDSESENEGEGILLSEAQLKRSLSMLSPEDRRSIQTPAIKIGYLSIGEEEISEEKNDCCSNARLFLAAVGGIFIPRVKWNWRKEIDAGGRQKSQLGFAAAFLLTLVSGLSFLTAFSQMDPFWGRASETFQKLSGKEEFAIIVGAISVGVMLLLYILDFHAGSRIHRVIGYSLFFLAAMGVSTAALLVAGTAGGAPIGVFVFWVPVLLGGMKFAFFKNVDAAWYLLGIFFALVLMSCGIITVWLMWLYFGENNWRDVKEDYFFNVGCEFINETQLIAEAAAQNTTVELPECEAAFIVWAAPPFLAAYCFIFANWVGYIIRSIVKARSGTINEPRVQSRQRFLQFLIIVFVFGIFATWITASLFADQFVSAEDTVVYISIETVVIAWLIYVATFGTENLKRSLITSPLGIKLVAFSESDWAKALVIFLFTPFVLIYLALAFITQLVRKHTFLGKSLSNAEERKLKFKVEAQPLLNSIRSMEYGSVLYKVIWVGIFWFLCIVGIGRMANVFLSWLNEILTQYTLLETVAIITAAGVGMFALPPMPGLPIYLTVGLIISRSAELEGFSFAAAGWISVGVCSLIKMLAICMQTKVIGTWLGSRSAYVRSVCQVNSVELRAMKKIMEVPGWSIPKVAVLVGGPDWPTSVLTGIMRLKLRQMLLGSLPVLVTIIPVSFAGAALLKNEEGIFGALGPLLLSVGVVVQLTPFFIAIHYIAKAAVENEEELANEELDEEVEVYNRKTEKKREWSYVLNKWENLSTIVRCFHVFMAVVGTTGNLTLFVYGDLAFEKFDVTDTIDDKLGGNVANLIKDPFGYIFLAMVGAPMLYVFLFGQVQAFRVRKRLEDNVKLSEEDIPALQDLRFSSLAQFTTQVRETRLNNLRHRLRNFTATTGRRSLRRSIGRLRRRSSKRKSADRNVDPRMAQLEKAEKQAEAGHKVENKAVEENDDDGSEGASL